MSGGGCFLTVAHRPYIKLEHLLLKTEVKLPIKTTALLNPPVTCFPSRPLWKGIFLGFSFL